MWAYVRKVGSIGVFYAVHFSDISTQDEWFDKYSDKWELHHFLTKSEYLNVSIPADTPKQRGLRNSDIW